ncbi:MAG: NUDIX domain-containing protein [Deltaproteobacteria bacterium]|nr:NUDIX domain-containing protein [Deltaproteobacteria bacterium]MCB9785871.1 NUDIX domain-containing protein [Deltaproteobacteria bacterium]
MSGEDAAPPRPAATVVLLDGESPPRILLLQRHRKSGFMARAHVFPGGRVDPEDAAPALLRRVAGVEAAALGASMALEPTEAMAHLVAAVRETFEEAGILLGRAAAEPASSLERWRERLNAREVAFAEMAEACDLQIDGGALSYFAHWVTPPIEPRRFDTRFFLARAPRGQRGAHDGRETTASVWLDARRALEEHAAGRFPLAPPTWRILGDLAPGADAGDPIRRAAEAASVQRIMPHAVQEEGAFVLALPGDALHPETAGSAGRSRIVLRDGRWSED